MTGTRINSKGRTIPSNHAIWPTSSSTYKCMGCGREFGDFDRNAWRPYSLANASRRLSAHTKARASRHADACKGPTPAAAAP